MNRNRFVIIGVVALALAAMVSVMIYRFVKVAMASNTSSQMVTVVAAASEVPVGTRLEEKDLRLVKMPQSELPPGAHRNTTEVLGRGVIVPLTTSELVLDSKLAPENAGAGMPALIPSGMRAVSVKVNDVVSVAGFVVAGTRVDVVLTGSPENNNTNVAATTVLENIQVLAAGQKLQRNEKGEPQQVTVITLLVSPDDAQKLVLASQEGRIQLALRNPLDTNHEVIPVIRQATLYRLQPGGGPESPSRVTNLAKKGNMRHFAKAVPPPMPVAPAPYIVEMIRGDKRDLSKF